MTDGKGFWLPKIGAKFFGNLNFLYYLSYTFIHSALTNYNLYLDVG